MDVAYKRIQNSLERNIYNFFIDISRNSGKEINAKNSIEWIKTYPSCWPNYIFDSKLKLNKIDDEIRLLKEKINTGIVPNSWFMGPGSTTTILPEILKQNGFIKTSSWPGMVLEMKNTSFDFSYPDNFSIKEINNLGDLKKWSDVINGGMFGNGFEGVNLFKNSLEKEDIKLFLGFFNDLPVATSLLYLNSDIASLFLVATLPDFRQRGFGTQITLAPIKKALGYGYEFAGLFATSSGERIYKKIGFRKICDFDIYYL